LDLKIGNTQRIPTEGGSGNRGTCFCLEIKQQELPRLSKGNNK
jgi:hypothetical protein